MCIHFTTRDFKLRILIEDMVICTLLADALVCISNCDKDDCQWMLIGGMRLKISPTIYVSGGRYRQAEHRPTLVSRGTRELS